MKQVKKILFINHSSAITGGAEDDFDRLLSHFSSMASEYQIYGIFPNGARSKAYSKYCYKFWNIKFSWLPLSKASINSYLRYLKNGFSECWNLRSSLRKYKFDLCIINVSPLFWPILYSKTRNYKCIVFIRESIQSRLVRKYYYKIISWCASYIFSVSNSLKNEYIKYSNKRNISVLYSSIEKNAGQNIIENCEIKRVIGKQIYETLYQSEYVKILLNASFYEIKNHILLLKALTHIDKSNLSKYRIFFLGSYDSNDPYYQKLKRFINENFLNETCIFMGVHSKEVVYEIYKNIDIVVLTSTSEGLPLVMVEALKMGKPFISTNLPGVTEIIKHKESGYIVEYDPKQLAVAIVEVSTDMELTRKLVVNGYKLFNSKFNLEKNLLQIEAKVNELINSSV